MTDNHSDPLQAHVVPLEPLDDAAIATQLDALEALDALDALDARERREVLDTLDVLAEELIGRQEPVAINLKRRIQKLRQIVAGSAGDHR